MYAQRSRHLHPVERKNKARSKEDDRNPAMRVLGVTAFIHIMAMAMALSLAQSFDDTATGLSDAKLQCSRKQYCTVALAWKKTLKILKESSDLLRPGVCIGSSLPSKKHFYRSDIVFYVGHGRWLGATSWRWPWWWNRRGTRGGFAFGYTCESTFWFSVQSCGG